MKLRRNIGIALSTALIASCAGSFVSLAHADGSTRDKAAVEEVLSKYEAALNAASTEQVLPLYAEDGVFMQPYGASVVGKSAIRQAYDKDFGTFRLHVKFHPIEFVEMSPKWAFVRTTSSGTNTINATHAQTAEANQELFIFEKTSGGWKIARYAFSTTNPPHG